MIDSGLIVTLYILVPLLTALCVTAVTTRTLIPFLKRIKTTQTIHEDVPDSHRQKAGTPTMGGVAILVGVACGGAVAMAMVRFSANMAVILAIAAVFGLIGFLDDYTKVVKRRNLGLTAKQKILLQLLVALILAL
jgi:phospho-N-acetylmuramoyl-pentapeptide-transferase